METDSTKIKTRLKRMPPLDSRSYRQRFMQALAPCALFFFIYLFFGRWS